MNPIVLTNATLIDPDHGARPGGHLSIVEGRIQHVGLGDPPTLTHARVIDLRGRSLMPGLFNCHYHSSYEGIGGPTALPVGMEAPPALQAMRAVRHVGLALDAGFTGLISAGATYGIDASLKLAIEQGIIRGPRIMAGSRDVSTTGHSLDNYYPWHWGMGSPPSINRCDGPDEFRRGVREEIKRGAEIIKVFATSGHGVNGAPNEMELSPDELSAAIGAAHERGAKIRAHIANRNAILTAVRLGIDAIDHADGMDLECIERIVEAGVFVAPSMLYSHRAAANRPAPVADRIREGLEYMIKILPVANEAGMKLVLGDDFGTVLLEHGDYADELDFYVNVAGIPARDVLRWATRHGAEMMGKGGELGELKPGALADLVVVDGDPLKNIKVLQDTRNVLAVIKGGTFQKNDLSRLDERH